MRGLRILLVIVALVCFAVAVSYPIRYRMKQNSNIATMEDLAALRRKALQENGVSPGEGPGATAAPRVNDVEAGEETEAPEVSLPGAEGTEAPEYIATEAPEISLPQAEVTEAPEDIATEAPEISLPQTEATSSVSADALPPSPEGKAEVSLPGAEVTEAPEISLPGAEVTEAPEISLPQAEETSSVSADALPPSPEGKATILEAEETGAPAETGIPAPTSVPAETGIPAPTSVPGETGIPAPTSAPGETGIPVPTSAPGETGIPAETSAPAETGIPAPTSAPGEIAPEATPAGGYWREMMLDIDPHARRTPIPTVEPTPAPTPGPTVDRLAYDGPMPFPMKEKVLFDESAILPELRDIYELNRDLIGWLTIPGTIIDYPVLQAEDSQYYLEHDFYGNSNMNGQILLDYNCDPYTPSYNLVISGHHMQNGTMFGDLPLYREQRYWEKHKFVEFDTLMDRKQYVIFAAFLSADYDEDEKGFRYNADIQYKLETRHWLDEIEENKLYDTGIDVEFGDEFITLTTCYRVVHRNGRFVVVCRKIREGETFE